MESMVATTAGIHLEVEICDDDCDSEDEHTKMVEMFADYSSR